MFQYTVKIDGMMCGMCEAHINDALRNALPQAKKVSSSHTKGEAVFLTEEPAAEDAVKKAIEDTGYHYLSIESVPFEKKGLFSKFKK